MGEPIIKYLLDTLYGPRKSNANMAKKLTQIGHSMGILKIGDDVIE